MEYVVDSEKPSREKKFHARIKTIDYRDVLTYVGATTIYIGTVIMMILLPVKLIPSSKVQLPNGINPNVGSNNNYLPAYCPIYTILANGARIAFKWGTTSTAAATTKDDMSNIYKPSDGKTYC